MRAGKIDLSPLFPLLLAVLPTVGLFVGAVFDQRHHLGFTLWAAACRAAGATPGSIIVFTRELLPSAIVGLLAGAWCIVWAGISARRHSHAVHSCLAAHAGCAVSMLLMLPVCTLALPPGVTLLTDALLAAVVTVFALRLFTHRPRAAAAHP